MLGVPYTCITFHYDTYLNVVITIIGQIKRSRARYYSADWMEISIRKFYFSTKKHYKPKLIMLKQKYKTLLNYTLSFFCTDLGLRVEFSVFLRYCGLF